MNKDILIIAISTTNTEWQRFSAVTVNVKSGFLKIFSKKPKKTNIWTLKILGRFLFRKP